MLAVEIEYLNRVSYAAKFDTPSEHEWPPHPDRLFMAMTAVWGEDIKDSEEEMALRWLEQQEPPEIAAPKASPRDSFRSFVPTSSNMANAGYLSGLNILQLRDNILRRERKFPAAVLPDDDSIVYMIWRKAEPKDDTKKALAGLVQKISRIGHSASLTRVALCDEPKSEPRYVPCSENHAMYLRCPRKGRLDSLVEEFDRSSESEVALRPSAASAVMYGDKKRSPSRSAMGDEREWVVMEFQGEPSTLTAFPPIAKKMRDAIMSHAEGKIHEVVSGHASDHTPTQKPHMAIVPMANVGWRWSDGALMGLALILPRKVETPERRQARQATTRFLQSGGNLSIGGAQFTLSRVEQPAKSLTPQRYTEQANVWESATPVVLDHHPKRNKSPASIVADACEKVGLPRPSHAHTSRHSSVRGAPPAYVKKDQSRGWHHPKPGFLDNKYVCHATIEFEQKVLGPVVLGAGRYYGLGLFLPSTGRRS